MPSRREFIAAAATGTIGFVAGRGGLATFRRGLVSSDGRLNARPRTPAESIEPGTHRLSVGGARDTVLFVPSSYRATKPAPFMLALHGATGSSDGPLRANRDAAERHGIVVLSPSSRGVSWDAIRTAFG